ncbi:MAG: glycosyltransferase family 4 protein [Planctomycetota bacterium]|nr:glycosyltransferase family 4 protein [Planctomycetota bacterium]
MSTDSRTVILAAGPFQVSGTSSYTLRLAELLPDFGYSPVIISPDVSSLRKDVRSKCPTHEYLLLSSPVFRPFVAGMVAQEAAAHRPSLIHVQSRHALSFGLALSQRLNLPCIVTLHDHQGSPPRVITNKLRLQRIIAVSDSVRDALVNGQSIKENLVTVIHSGVQVPDLFENAEVLGSQRIPVIGTAGRLENSKGFPFFIQAARKVLDAGNDVEFLIAGSGPEERRLRALARQLKLTDHITFITNLPDFRSAIRAMDIFCLPSLMQGLGTVMLEAMALGRPVIATGVGGVTAILKDGETGLVVPASDSDRLAERMMELLADPVRARAIGSAARQRVIEAFDVTRMVELTVDEYQTAIASECASSTRTG